MKKRLIRIVSVCLSLIVFITSLNLSFLVKAEGTNPSVYINPSNTQAIYTYDGYYVVFNLNGSWTGGHNVGIQIYNTGSETIEDWTLESDYSNNISNIWNASVLENANGVTKLYHDTWNSVIYPNSCVEFGYSSNETFDSFPSYFGMLGSEITETNNELYLIDYNVTNEWEDGYTGLITITNNSENIIRNWALDFSCNNDNISVWNAELISKEDNRVSVGNMGFNADINPGENVTFGFIVYNKTNNDAFYDYSLSESVFITNEPQRELEPLEDIGEAYCKELRDEDVVFDEATGLQYVKNQLLISAYMGTPREAVEEIVDEVGAAIVGYIEITCDYQIEFNEAKTLEELQSMVDYINGYSFISFVSLNLVSDVDNTDFTNDALYKDGGTCVRDDYNGMDYIKCDNSNPDLDSIISPGGDNWGLEALNIPSAWPHITNSSTVKVGIYDTYFINRYEGDKTELIFDDIRNPDLMPEGKERDHGTHVAGIIGAKSNNGTGISGVTTDVRLYGYSYLTLDQKKYFSFAQKIAFAKLICNHVKIINVSLGYSNELVYAASDEDFSSYNNKALKLIEEDSNIIEEFLLKLQNAGYDYLFVCSAGNSNDKRYVLTNENHYGIKEFELKDETVPKTYDVEARYNYNLSAIDNPKVRNRIIVVGSIDQQFNFSRFSNAGERVDVCAPGENILSTIPKLEYPIEIKNVVIEGYDVKTGTSMSTPYISGLAALILQVNPDLNGAEVKKIICDDNNRRVLTKNTDGLNMSHNIPNGEKCILEALNYTNNSNIQGGHLTGVVKNTEGIIVHNVDICAIRDVSEGYSVDLDSFSYNFENGSNAEFNIFLPQGKYDIIFSAEGYLPNVIKNVEINVNENKTLPVELIKYTSNTSGNYVKGIVVDAATGEPVENATVGLRKNWGNVDGEYATSLEKGKMQTQTSHNGEFSIHALNGNYTASVSKDGYITGYYNVIPVGYDENNILRLALSPMLSEDEYRIVLTWDQSPGDLDSHLTYTTDEGNIFHVYFVDKKGRYNNKDIAILDTDQVSGYGPETITINLTDDMLENGYFKYFIYNCTSYAGAISESNAIIRVYKGNNLIHDPIYAPSEAIKNCWYAFDITSNGIVIRNEYMDGYYDLIVPMVN